MILGRWALSIWLLASFLGCGRSAPAKTDSDSTKLDSLTLLWIQPGDVASLTYVGRVLDANRIKWSVFGSIAWPVSVAVTDRGPAERLLKQEEGLRGYIMWPPNGATDSKLPEARVRSQEIRQVLSEALIKHGPDTLVGQVLRAPTVLDEVSRDSEIVSIGWWKRPMRTADLRLIQAVVGHVVARPPGSNEQSVEFALVDGANGE